MSVEPVLTDSVSRAFGTAVTVSTSVPMGSGNSIGELQRSTTGSRTSSAPSTEYASTHPSPLRPGDDVSAWATARLVPPTRSRTQTRRSTTCAGSTSATRSASEADPSPAGSGAGVMISYATTPPVSAIVSAPAAVCSVPSPSTETTSATIGSLWLCAPMADAYALTRPTTTTAVAPRASLWPRLDVESTGVAPKVSLGAVTRQRRRSAGDAAHHDGDLFGRLDGLDRGQQAGQTRAAGRAHVEACRLRKTVRGDDVGLGGDDRDVAPRPDRLEHTDPVVGLVVEDAVSNGVRIPPRHHQLGPQRCGEFGPTVGTGLESPPPGTGERGASLGLHGVEPSGRGGRTETSGEGAAADLHEDAVEVVDPGADELVADLPADGAAAVEGEGVLRALHGERDGAGGNGLAEAEHRRVARWVGGATLAAVCAGAEPVEFVAEPGGHPRGHEHVDRPVGCSGEGRCSECSVAARRDRERWPCREVAEFLGSAQVQEDREEVAGLLAATDSPGLVLHPDAATVREAEGVGQRCGPPERRRDESGAGDGADRGVEVADETAAGGVVEAVDVGVGGPGEVVVVADVGVGIGLGLGHQSRTRLEADISVPAVALDDLQDVAAIVLRRVGAAPRERRGDVDGRRTDGTAPAGDPHRRRQPATRALKSSIMSSHTPT